MTAGTLCGACDPHVIDDIESKRTALLRAANRSQRMLEDARHAIQNNRNAVADELVDRVMADLAKAIAEQAK